MYTFNEQLKTIATSLEKYNIKVPQEQLSRYLKTLPKDIIDNLPSLLDLKVANLNKLLKKLQEDCDVKRTAGKIIEKLFNEDIFNLIIDNDSFFKEQLKNENIKPSYRVALCERAALVNSKKVVNLLLDENCNPARYPSLLIHIMCANDVNWTFDLIKKWKVDVVNSDYLFDLYAHRLDDPQLKEYFSQKKLEANENLTNQKKSLSKKINLEQGNQQRQKLENKAIKKWENDTDFQSKWNQYNTALAILQKKVSRSNNPSQDERILSMFDHTRLLFNDVRQHASEKPWNSEWIDAEGKKAMDVSARLKGTLFPSPKLKQTKPQAPKNHQKANSFVPNNMQEELARDKKISELQEEIEKYPKKDPYGKLRLIIQLEKEEKKSRKEHQELFELLSYMQRLSIFKNDFTEFCQKGDLAAVKIFIEFFNDYPSLDYRNDGLLSSVQSGHLAIVQYLLEEAGANPSYKLGDGWNLAHHAAWHNQPQILFYLLKKYNQLYCQMTPRGLFNGDETILHLAIRNKAREAVNAILQIAPTQFINCQEQSGYTPLHYAVYYKLIDFIKLLLPISDLSIKNNKEKTAYGIAEDNAKDGIIFSASQEAKQILNLFKAEIQRRQIQQTQQQHHIYYH